MKFLYVAPRFHPNQYPIITGLIEKGHEVMFCVAKVGKTEKHNGIVVSVLTPSKLSIKIEKQYKRKSEVLAETKMLFWFIPKIKQVKKIFYEYKPDIVIIREKTILSLVFLKFAKKTKTKILLYDQKPVYIKKIKKNKIQFRMIMKKIWMSLFPKSRITVVNYAEYPYVGDDYIKDENAYFMPFVPRKIIRQEEKQYFLNNRINIFACGKYRRYKNHMILLEAINIIYRQGYKNFFVTIVGQAVNEEEKIYYSQLEKYISENGLCDFVELKLDIPYDEVENYYINNDIFILSSERELANVSILDAMSYALATVATSANGTSHYIRDNETGFIFRTKDVVELSEKLKQYIDNPELIVQYGRNAHGVIRDDYNFEQYYTKFEKIIEKL